LYFFYTHGLDDTWVSGLSSASAIATRQPFTTCGACSACEISENNFKDPYHYTGIQVIPGSNSKYRYRFFYNESDFVITAAGYYPADKAGGKDISLRVLSGSWK
jgi:hypothetical protein